MYLAHFLQWWARGGFTVLHFLHHRIPFGITTFSSSSSEEESDPLPFFFSIVTFSLPFSWSDSFPRTILFTHPLGPGSTVHARSYVYHIHSTKPLNHNASSH